MTPIPERLLPTEQEVFEYLDGRRVGTIMDYLARIKVNLSPAEAWALFFDGMRQMGLLKPGERV